ncbi:MAG: AAA family ATPase, partial [Spirulina sp.]
MNVIRHLPGYRILELLYESSCTLVYRGMRESDRQPIALKILQQDYPTPAELTRYKQEYEIVSNLRAEGVIQAYDLIPYPKTLAIVLEDFGGESLDRWLQKRRTSLSPSEFLPLGIKIARGLANIHGARVIHKDINPSNIVLNPETQQVKFIDFGISTALGMEMPPLEHPNILKGTLPYISPEQTGRMNRKLDYRTDFYSLGATFYEMLAGQLPFGTTEVMELVHAHLARQPMPLHEVNSEIPVLLSAIVLKLMAKNAEDRYQSAEGLLADLEECQRQWQSDREILIFPLGRQDIADRLQIPEKLYGREKEIERLLNAFARVVRAGTVEIMLVAGSAGIGKSVLVQELYKPIAQKRGYFIAGKFDQFQRNIPYSAIVNAFAGLVRQLLGEPEERLQGWREKLLGTLRENGQVIIEVIPEVELIIGKQPSLPKLEGFAARERFHLTFENFIRVFCSREHPLTLFLDDLQWADSASLQLLEAIIKDRKTENLLVLAAYRDNEVNATHPFAMTARKLQREGAKVETLTLEPLKIEDIVRLIADTLKQTPEAVKELAELIVKKTRGNPFFVGEFLKNLNAENLLSFDRTERKWQWTMEAIEGMNFTDNVVEFMMGKLQKLPPFIQNSLSLAACLGTEFALETLVLVEEREAREIYEDLKIALGMGLILPRSALDENLQIQDYKFGHDRIQQAAYKLIPEGRQPESHYRIGQKLLDNLSLEEREERIFEVVNQLNNGRVFVTAENERDELARLNLMAGRKARAATAYQAGRNYAEIGLSLLGERAWQEQYQTGLALHDLGAELASLCGDVEAMERTIATTIARSRSLLDRVNADLIKIQSHTSRNKLTEAIATGRQSLQQFGVTFPERPTPEDIQQALAEIDTAIGDREIEDLLHLPAMSDREKAAMVEIANSLIAATYIVGSPLYPLLVAFSVKTSIQSGNTLNSAFGYASYGVIACNLLQNVNIGVRFGRLAESLVSQAKAKAVRPQILIMEGVLILHRKYPARATLPLLKSACETALDVGSLEFFGYGLHSFCQNAFWCGQLLTPLEGEARAACQSLVQLDLVATVNYCRIHWQPILNLLGVGERPTLLSGEALQEEAMLSQLLAARDFMGLYLFSLYKLMLCYLFGEIAAARDHGVEVRRYWQASMGLIVEPAFYFYDALVALAALSSQGEGASEIYQQVEENQTRLQQQWAHYAPMNYQHKVDLIEAEKCRVSGQKAEAIERYDRAIAGARENDYIQEEALANELAAKFYLDWGKDKIARTYLQEARYSYLRWGAKAKVKDLEQRYPQLLASMAREPRKATTEAKISITTDSFSTDSLDLNSVLKASQALAREIHLDALLTQILEIVMENVGAQTGHLILQWQQHWAIAASRHKTETIVNLERPLPLDSNADLQLSREIVNTVIRARDPIVLGNAACDETFSATPYIRQHQPQSILCFPLLHQGQAIGILYLENNLTPDAFTPKRLEVLNLLAGQAAVALENARLYANLEDQVAQRTRDLSQALDDLKTTQEELIQSEKMAALGQLIAGIAHELNTPLGAIRSSIGNLNQFFDRLQQLPDFFQNLPPERQRDFLALLQCSSSQTTLLSTREQRQLKRSIIAQ